MQKIAVITDSCSDLSFDTLEKYQITMFPIRIIYKERDYLDKIEISSEEMHARLKDEVPSTSLPDLHYCEVKVHELKAEGFTDFIIIGVSPNLSGTLNALRILTEHHPDAHFHFFDTLTLGYPQDIIAVEAASLVLAGASVDIVMSKLENIRKRTHGYIALNTLEYLKKGKCSVWVLQGDALAEATALWEELKSHQNINRLSLEKVGPSMGVHTGSGVVGFAILEEY